MRLGSVILGVVGLALALTLALAPTVQAHAYLDASTPPPNGNVPEGKSVLALRFTEVIDPEHTTVSVLGPNGTRVATEIDRPSDRPRVLRVEVPPLEAGIYELRWSSFSIDSHVDHGTFAFTVGSDSEPLEGPVQPYDPGAQDGGLVALETLGRLGFLVGALLAFGLPIYLSEVEPGDEAPKGASGAMLAGGLVGLGGVGLLFGVMVDRLGAGVQVAATTLPGLFLVAKASLMGLVVGLAVWAGRLPPDRRMRPLLACIVAGIVALVVHSMSGHGVLEMTSRESAAGHVAMTLHLAGSGLWFGGLVGLLLTARDTAGLVARIRAFTPLAIVSVLAIGGTGLVQAYVHLPSLAALWTSSFGWALLVKTSLLGAVLVLGAWHGFGLPDRLEADSSQSPSFMGSGTTEAVILTGVLLAAAVMGAVPVPSEGVDLEDGPLAVFEDERRLPNHDLRVRILADPIWAGEPVRLDLTVEPTSSVGTDELTASATLDGPANRSVPLDLEPAGSAGAADTARVWQDPEVVVPEPGAWTLTLNLTLPSGPVTERFPVTIQPHPGSG